MLPREQVRRCRNRRCCRCCCSGAGGRWKWEGPAGRTLRAAPKLGRQSQDGWQVVTGQCQAPAGFLVSASPSHSVHLGVFSSTWGLCPLDSRSTHSSRYQKCPIRSQIPGGPTVGTSARGDTGPGSPPEDIRGGGLLLFPPRGFTVVVGTPAGRRVPTAGSLPPCLHPALTGISLSIQSREVEVVVSAQGYRVHSESADSGAYMSALRINSQGPCC